MLPFWIGNKITREETIEILQEHEGNEGKGRIFMDVNKSSIIINTKVNFPGKPGKSGEMRLHDFKNGLRFNNKVAIPVFIRKSRVQFFC